MAVAETTVEQKATITVYDLLHEGAKKRKVLSNAELQSTEFNSIAFSPDSKYLAAQESVFLPQKYFDTVACVVLIFSAIKWLD